MGWKTITILIFILSIFLFSCLRPKKNNFSKAEQQTVQIITKYTGASPHVMERNITVVIENAVSGIKGVKKISSRSVQDLSIVTIQFDDNVDILLAKQLVNEQIQKISSQLPKDVLPPIIIDAKPAHKNKFPEVEHPTICIITKHVGASPPVIENAVTKVIENAVKSIGGLKRLSSRSVQDSSIVTLQFADYVNISAAKELVTKQIQEIIPQLPHDVLPPIISDTKPAHFCIKIDINGSDELDVLSSKAKALVNELYKIQGIKLVETKGNELQPFVAIVMDIEKLSNLGISTSEVASALKNASEIKDYNSGMVIRITPEIKNPEDYENIVIAEKNGAPVYLKDVATTEMKEDVKEIVRENNQRVAIVYVALKEEVNLKTVHLKIETLIAEMLKTSLPNLSYKVSDLH